MPSGWSESCHEQRRFRNLQVCTSQKYSAVPTRLTHVLYPPASHTVRLESINLLTLRALPDFRWGGRNGNDDRSRSGREFRSAITSCKSGSTRRSETAGHAPGGPNRPETSKNESKRNRSTQKRVAPRTGALGHLTRFTISSWHA